MYFSPPDRNEYYGNRYARLSTEYNFPTKINISQFENYYLSEIDRIIEENNSYYYKEDQFDTRRISIVSNLFKDLDDIYYQKSVLSFNLQASEPLIQHIDYPEALVHI
ncbi:MAG: hypothetical protein PF693_07355 [Spirochaetia bacterium]|jgi:hypothetical protein|nr:hypothetical protein [Spirochaetia bacterium]